MIVHNPSASSHIPPPHPSIPLDLPLSLMFTVASREYLANPRVSPPVHPQSPRIPQNCYQKL
ncbi:hypothetical protein M422DRAFT_38789 [Sphaerobolus stellatus SS14]|uniref:Uncharacterized protein n=1 Tax=Sphaerobolus stellatus (strain SS14) TaxID=990650 RepID=A0A0C9U8N8_SPHS4|nr:hypothetical protein M422DRAFT_38789 [Sphaerobolus stellatus SS14]